MTLMPKKQCKSNNRVKNFSKLTVYTSFATATRRCEFEGRNEYVFRDSITLMNQEFEE